MSIDHSTYKPGHGSGSICHKFDIRERGFGKRWHVYDYTSNSTVFESNRKNACVKWVQRHEDLFSLVSTHPWGMLKLCVGCQKMVRLESFRLNGTPGTERRKNAHFRSKCLKCERAMDKARYFRNKAAVDESCI